MSIKDGATVEIDYELFDERGNLIESTADDGPVRYVHGTAEILPGLERALEGLAAGGEVEVTLEPAEAFGDYDPEGLVTIPRGELPAELPLERGEFLAVCLEPDDASEELDEDEREMEMRIVEVHDEEVIVDANHPLAGKRVRFRVTVRSVSSGKE